MLTRHSRETFTAACSSHSPVSLAFTRAETVLTWLKEKLQRGLAVQTLNVMEESMA